MSKYSKFIVAVVGSGLTLFADNYGPTLGLESGWVEAAMAVLTPIIVWAVPNKKGN